VFYGTPFISGKDSLNNEYLGADGQRHAIPPTLLISAIGIIQDVNTAITMDLKATDNLIYLLGDFSTENKSVPNVPASAPHVYRALHQAIQNKLVKSCHDLSEGGLAIAAAEMCIGGRLGMELNIEASSLFTEVNGCLLVEVTPANASAFEALFANLPFTNIGKVTQDPFLNIRFPIRESVSISVADLVCTFNALSRP
jgi:phosphoribosylformylglycinamidine synthase